MDNSSDEYDRLKSDVERARLALNSTSWWQLIRRQEAADRYKRALLVGALWELRHPEVLANQTSPG